MFLSENLCKLIFVVSFLFLQGCASIPKPVDKRTQIDLKNSHIAIEVINEVGRYTVKNNESKTLFMGVLTPLYLVIDRYMKTNKVIVMIDSSSEEFAAALYQQAESALIEKGYSMQQKPYKDSTTPSTVVLTLRLMSMGFSDDDNAGEYVPFIYVQVSLTSLDKHKIYYVQRFAIGNKAEAGRSSIYTSNNITFNGFEQLINNPTKARYSFDMLVEQMAKQIATKVGGT